MTNPKNAILEIKKLMKQFGFFNEEKFLDVKLVDGTQLKVDGESLEIGAKVMVITEEGEIPAPNGEYELEDGSKIEIAEGVISEVKGIEEPVTEEVPAEEAPVELIDEPIEEEPVAEEPAEAEPIVAAVVEALLPILEEIKSLTSELKSMKAEMEAVKNDFEAFKKEPAAKPIKSGKIEITETSIVEQKLAAIRSLRNKK